MIAGFLRLVMVLVAVGVCAFVALVVYSSLGSGFLSGRIQPEGLESPVSPGAQPQIFTVQSGQSAAAIGDELQRRGLIRSTLAFRWEVESRGIGGKIAAGDYELSASMSTPEIAEALARGPLIRGVTLTILEGWRLEQVAVRVEELHLVQAEDLARTAQAPREHGVAPPEGVDSLEGYLFPETYQIDPKATTIQILQTMLQQFDKRVDERLRQQATDGGLSLHQAVTLASIIEREARDPNERPIISSVYHNRLASGMRLDADPTVQYAVASVDLNAALAYGFWKHDLTAQDLAIDSPYNTYRRPGLPPGPICSPGLDSLRAAVAPASTRYLYFVARGDGSHAFAETPEQHEQNVAKYR